MLREQAKPTPSQFQRLSPSRSINIKLENPFKRILTCHFCQLGNPTNLRGFKILKILSTLGQSNADLKETHLTIRTNTKVATSSIAIENPLKTQSFLSFQIYYKMKNDIRELAMQKEKSIISLSFLQSKRYLKWTLKTILSS